MEDPSNKPEPQMLGGDEDASIDDKGRLLLNKRQRDLLGEDFVLSVSEYGCLQIYPAWAWDEFRKEFKSIDFGNPYRLDYYDEVYGKAVTGLKFDGQDRISIPKNLREEFSLGSKVRVVGVGDRFFLWNTEELKRYRSDKEGYNKANRDRVRALRDNMLAERNRKIRENREATGLA
ncbi:MAG: hypothetical protein ABUL72_03195 [Armatimonadota bacterium]